jgi:hypothetical protein
LHPGLVEPEKREAALFAWLQGGWDPHLQPEGGRLEPEGDLTRADRSPWAMALLGGPLEWLDWVLKAGAEVDRPIGLGKGEASGWVPPLMAVLSGPLEMAAPKIRLLKEGGPLVMHGVWPIDDRRGDTILHLAVASQNQDDSLRPGAVEKMIRDLLEETVGRGTQEVLWRDRVGAIPLHDALRLGRFEVAQRLLQVAPQAQARAVDHAGNGAFHALVEGGWNPTNGIVAKALADHGASWTMPNIKGQDALAWAVSRAPQEEAAWRALSQRTSPGR